MNKFLVILACFGFLSFFSGIFEAEASDPATAPLLEGNAKKPTHQLTSATLLEPDVSGKSTINTYMGYYASHNATGNNSHNLLYVLRDLKNNADDLDDFKMSAHDFRIPDYFITGLWNDFHNPELASYIKAILEKKTETTGSRTKAEMDISALSSDMFSQSTNHSSASGLGQRDAADVQSDDDDEVVGGSCAQNYSTAHKRKPYSNSPTPFVSTQ